jgi:hypothetical protein
MESGMYAYVKGDAMLNDDGTAGVDDALFEIGAASWYLKAGRFEAESLFGKGNDVYIFDVTNIGGPGRYQTNAARGRADIGFALGFKPGENLLVEIGMLYDNASYANCWDLAGVSQSCDTNKIGVRPLVKFSGGSFTVKAGGEYILATPSNEDYEAEQTTTGFGADASFTVSGFELGAAGAFRTVGGKDLTGADVDDEKTLSTFGWAKVPVGGGSLGVGAGFTKLSYKDSNDEESMMEGYVVYDTPLPVDGAAAKFAVSYGKVKLEPAGGSDIENSGFGARLRLWYEIPLI